MKAGELYDLAKQVVPNLTIRMFTQFYNQAMEQLSREIRISVIEQAYTDIASYQNLPVSAVRIESVSTDGRYYWKIVNNELKLYDADNVEVTSIPDNLVISYWAAIINALAEVIDSSGFTNSDEFKLQYLQVVT